MKNNKDLHYHLSILLLSIPSSSTPHKIPPHQNPQAGSLISSAAHSTPLTPRKEKMSSRVSSKIIKKGKVINVVVPPSPQPHKRLKKGIHAKPASPIPQMLSSAARNTSSLFSHFVQKQLRFPPLISLPTQACHKPDTPMYINTRKGKVNPLAMQKKPSAGSSSKPPPPRERKVRCPARSKGANQLSQKRSRRKKMRKKKITSNSKPLHSKKSKTSEWVLTP